MDAGGATRASEGQLWTAACRLTVPTLMFAFCVYGFAVISIRDTTTNHRHPSKQGDILQA